MTTLTNKQTYDAQITKTNTEEINQLKTQLTTLEQKVTDLQKLLKKKRQTMRETFNKDITALQNRIDNLDDYLFSTGQTDTYSDENDDNND